MEFEAPGHVYKCVPPVLGIKRKWDKYQEDLKKWEENKEGEKPEEVKPVIIGMKRLVMPIVDTETKRESYARVNLSMEEASKIVEGYTKDNIRAHVDHIENLVVGGKEVTDFDTFYDVAPIELVSWVCKAIYSTMTLSDSELKN